MSTESTARHTPGPWDHGKNPKEPFSITGPDGCLIGRRSEWKDEPQEAEANGDLIAAAPDLRAALSATAKALLELLDGPGDGHGHHSAAEINAAKAAMVLARAALAKAPLPQD